MSDADSIEQCRKEMGSRLLILGHYYQPDSVLAHTDFVGDSLELSRRAAEAKTAEKIVFCGVRFMAESADILTDKHQSVYMPAPEAGCPMADMMQPDQVQAAWQQLFTISEDWVPITYVNSSACVKAFCGQRGGLTCTSSNAAKVFNSLLGQDKRIFFLPDQHLGANTAHEIGLAEHVVAVYDPAAPDGGLTRDALAVAKLVIWKGHCPIHTEFTAADIERARAEHPGALIIVHPETPKEAAVLADARGSTSAILRYVQEAPEGSTVIVGTEITFVKRLAAENKDRVKVVPLRESLCENMSLTTESKLASVLASFPESNLVTVPQKYKAMARKALERMLAL